jgi:hypothetical protein
LSRSIDPFDGLTPTEYQRRREARDAARLAETREWRMMLKPNQGEVACPMVISDSLGIHGVQSQGDGKHYDSKAALRQHYRRDGFVEVGNDGETRRSKQPTTYMEREANRRRIEAAAGKALSAVNTMSGESIKARRHEREQRKTVIA